MLVNRLIEERTISGELDNANLTFRRTPEVQNIFLQVLQDLHHPRVVYPEPSKRIAPGAGGSQRAALRCPSNSVANGRLAPGGVEEIMTPLAAANMAVEG